MDNKYWDNPEKFNPQRFIENGQIKKYERMIPFGKGSLTTYAAWIRQNIYMYKVIAIFARKCQAFVSENLQQSAFALQ